MTTGISFALGLGHTQQGHPEHAGRMVAVQALLRDRELLGGVGTASRLRVLASAEATPHQLRRVHDRSQVDSVQRTSARGGGVIGADTYVTAETWHEASLAAGSCIAATEAVWRGEVDNALAVVRPPGHHAERRSVEGFCLFNNIAVAAQHARAALGVERIAIIDFDVHHGNGTQDIFFTDENVLFVSTHMFARYFYPGSGHHREMGLGAGRGYNINIPLPPGTGDRGYASVFDEIIEPVIRDFAPQLILVSAGYDAHWRDPLAHMQLSITGYTALAERLQQLAAEVCGGKIVYVTEGGYDLDVLAYSVLNLIYVMLGDNARIDPIGTSLADETDISELIVNLRQQHLMR